MSKFKKGTVINGRFLLIECLGTWLFSQVWRAIDETLDVEVALKVYAPLTSDGMKELKREYSNTMGVSHQNLLTPQGMDVCSDGAYLVMKCCSKGSAAALAGMVDEDTVWRFVRDVSAGLTYLHGLDEPIIHQDMRLANIMIDNDDHFLISDFGICYKVTQIMVRQTGRGRSASLAYMSPERFSADYDEPLTSSDIWTLGALVYELCTGVPPFGDFGGAAQRNGQMMPALPRGWSKELRVLLDACLQINTWDRPLASKIYDYATMMLKNQHPGPDVLGVAVQTVPPPADYTKNTLDSLFGQTGQTEPVYDAGNATNPDTSATMPEYVSMGNSDASAGFSGNGDTAMDAGRSRDFGGGASEDTHFTSGTRYRGRSDHRSSRPVRKHRSTGRKILDWIKSKSSVLSFLLIVAACAGVYWYGLDNLLSLKFLPEDDSHENMVTERTQEIEDPDALYDDAALLQDTAKMNPDLVMEKSGNMLPSPPPPRVRKGVSSIGIDNAQQGGTTLDKENTQTGGTTVAPGPAQAQAQAPVAVSNETVNNKGANTKVGGNGKKSEARAVAKPEASAPVQSGLSAAVQKGDYAAIKKMADNGSAAAAGVMARKYHSDHNYAAADEYAQKAKKGGDPAGDEVINKLKVQGYYQ